MIAGGEKFYKTLQYLASKESFKLAIERLPESSFSQKGDEELVLRFFAVKNFIHGYKGNVEDWLDSYMEEILFERIKFDSDVEGQVFERVFDLIANVFGKDAFARTKGTEGTGRLAPAYFEAAVGGVLANLETLAARDPAELRERLYSLYSSEPFREVTGPGANTIPKLNGRIDLVRTVLA